jgi:hypothetical protein
VALEPSEALHGMGGNCTPLPLPTGRRTDRCQPTTDYFRTLDWCLAFAKRVFVVIPPKAVAGCPKER